MKIINKNSRYSLKSTFRNLFEQGLFGDEPAGDEAAGDEAEKDEPAAGDDAGGDKADDSAEDDTDKADDKPDESKKEEKEQKIYISDEDEARLADVVDQEIEAVLIDFETDARKSAAIDKKSLQGESRSFSIKKFLLEDAADDIDLKRFASDVARLVKNYDTLLDMQSIILNRSFSYILSKYGEETEKALRDVLEQDHRLVSNEPKSVPSEEPEIPIAVGARKPE
jgi:hypothetical protein